MPPKKQSAIGLFFYTTPHPEETLTPEKLFYLVPSSVYWCVEEGGKHYFLLRLLYGRRLKDVEEFMTELMASFPLLVEKHVIFESHQASLVNMKARHIMERPTAQKWDLGEQCKSSPFDTAEAFLAWIMTKVFFFFFFFFSC